MVVDFEGEPKTSLALRSKALLCLDKEFVTTLDEFEHYFARAKV